MGKAVRKPKLNIASEATIGRRTLALICIGLVVAVFAIYWQVSCFEFSGYDDDDYVTANPHVQQGLTGESIRWAFTRTYASNWHPLTWMSHMLDWQLFELDPAGHHLVNVLFHAANGVLLLLLLVTMTGRLWASALVAALFAVHPLHAESVAWVAERKDVLSTFFWILVMLAYARYVRDRGSRWYVLVLVLYALGLMAKPMLVTLPIVLLLVDYWPMARFSTLRPLRSAVLEKAPLLALAAASCVVTWIAQQSGGAVTTLQAHPIGVRLANAAVASIAYIVKMVWPKGLIALYPHPGAGLPVWQVIGSVFLLAAITLLALVAARRRPYVAVGWFWYVVTLVPVIGLVQVGRQGMADRYTYIPLIGLFVIVAWAGSEALSALRLSSRARALAAGVPAVLVLAVLSVGAYIQTGYWRDDMTLWRRVLSVDPTHSIAFFNLGCDYYHQGDRKTAISYYRRALRVDPRLSWAHYNLAVALEEEGDVEGAERHYSLAIRHFPRYAAAHSNLGLLLARSGRYAEAMEHYEAALRADPGFQNARDNMRRLKEFLRADPNAGTSVLR